MYMYAFMKEHPSMFNTARVILVFILVILAINSFGFLKKSTVSLTIEDDVFTVSYEEETLIQFSRDEIVSAEYLDGLEPGSAVEDLSVSGYLAGTWENDAWGTYTLCVKQSVGNYILLETADARFVFNYESAGTTEGIYNALLAW